MRIVGGRWRGRPLTGPASQAIRPTSDRLRGAIFNILAHGHDDPVQGARVLDLFAGTGALGLEALSRGADHALLVDNGREASALLSRNVEALGGGDGATILVRDAVRIGSAGPLPPFDLVFCDPPYGLELAPSALRSCADGGWLRVGALAVVEERAGSGFAFPPGFVELDRRRYGDTEVAFGRCDPRGEALTDG